MPDPAPYLCPLDRSQRLGYGRAPLREFEPTEQTIRAWIKKADPCRRR